MPLGGRPADRVPLHRQGFVPARIHAKPLEDVKEITFLGQQIAEKHPVVKEWKLGSPARSAARLARHRQGHLPLGPRHRASSRSTPWSRATRTSRRSALRANFSDPLVPQPREPDGLVHAGRRTCPRTSATTCRAELQRYDWTLGVPGERRRLLRPLRPHEDEPQGLGRGPRLQPQPDLRRAAHGWTCEADVTYYGDLDRMPDYQGDADELHRQARDARAAALQGLPALARLRRRGEGAAAGTSASPATASRARCSRSSTSNLDLGLALPLPHSSVWLRGSAGWGPGDKRDEPFANFYFGGFGNNWVDHREEKRYRESTPSPASRSTRWAARTIAKGMLEWNLPPLRFRGAGTPSFYATWLRPAALRERARHQRRRQRAPAHASATPARSSTCASACSPGWS